MASTSALRPARTRFTALHGLAVAADRLAALATALALPVRAADAPEPVLALMDGPAGAGDVEAWERPFAAWIEPDRVGGTGGGSGGATGGVPALPTHLAAPPCRCWWSGPALPISTSTSPRRRRTSCIWPGAC
ncbi:hypothetical protein ACIU1J_13290 [Azospirillum doebereinerae]|uniref:hypothetical protein n=1 Tax=Azospirillum doebereinerae TaxID=92933 RepID=UPI00384ADD94